MCEREKRGERNMLSDGRSLGSLACRAPTIFGLFALECMHASERAREGDGKEGRSRRGHFSRLSLMLSRREGTNPSPKPQASLFSPSAESQKHPHRFTSGGWTIVLWFHVSLTRRGQVEDWGGGEGVCLLARCYFVFQRGAAEVKKRWSRGRGALAPGWCR